MDSLLNELEAAVTEVEDQLIAEYDRIRSTQSDQPYEPVDPGVKTALNDVVMQLWNRLENSGDESNLTLRTERHEELSMRMIVVKKLLDAQVPTAFLSEVHAEGQAARKRPASNKRESQITVHTEAERKGLLGSIKGMFGSKDSATARSSNEGGEPAKKVDVYAEGSVYTTAQALASLAKRFSAGGDEKALMNAAASGTAVFNSKELTGAALAAVKAESKAQTPEEIRRKLAERGTTVDGTSSFGARELSSQAPPDRSIARTPEEIRRKLEKKNAQQAGASRFEARDVKGTPPPAAPANTGKIAQSPEEIRRKLAERESQQAGKAQFGARDIEPAPVPAQANKPQISKAPPKPPGQPPASGGGKAVFESKDLSSPKEK